MLTAITSKILDLKDLDQLEEIRRSLFKAVRKHKRKLVRVKLYLNGEKRFILNPFMKGLLRVITLRLGGSRTDIGELELTLTRLSYLIDSLGKASREYLTLVKEI